MERDVQTVSASLHTQAADTNVCAADQETRAMPMASSADLRRPVPRGEDTRSCILDAHAVPSAAENEIHASTTNSAVFQEVAAKVVDSRSTSQAVHQERSAVNHTTLAADMATLARDAVTTREARRRLDTQDVATRESAAGHATIVRSTASSADTNDV